MLRNMPANTVLCAIAHHLTTLTIMNSKLSNVARKAPGTEAPGATLDNFIELNRVGRGIILWA